ncbi:MAG TPA: PcfJ domain-containing protein [Noviherbaspirillum sp.]|nr:PcfJ domain-containing protein [Noviherbaspirillum sp.]
MQAQETSLAYQLREACFPGVDDPDLQDCVESLLCCVRAEEQIFRSGPVARLLLTANLAPGISGTHNWRTGRATARLHLADGALWELHLSGNISAFLLNLPHLGTWLAGQPPAVGPELLEAQLAKLVSGPGSMGPACHITVPRYASVVPRRLVSEGMALRMAFGTLNLLRREHGLAPLLEAPPLLAEYVTSTHLTAARAIDKYVAGLNPDVLRFIQEYRSRYHPRYDDLKVYNFLNGGHGNASRNRIQAIRELPWLLRILSGMDAMFSLDSDTAFAARRMDPETVAALTAAIDAGQPLFSSVAQVFRVPVETVKWSRGQMLPLYGGFAVPRMDLLLTILSWLPPEKRPRSDAEWRHLQTIISTLFSIAGGVRDERNRLSGPEMIRHDGPAVAAWLREITKPTLVAAAERFDRMCRAGDDPENAKDFLRAVGRSFRRFCADGGAQACHADMLHAWLGQQSFFRVMSLSRRWHAAMQAHLVSNGAVNPESGRTGSLAWPLVLDNALHLGAVSIAELGDSKSLEAEGKSMEHCVAGYSQKCAMENCVIVSVRDVAGFRLSTAELAIREEPLRVELVQHKGRRNTLPSPGSVSAVAHLLQYLNHPDCNGRLASRHAFQKACRQQYDALLERMPDSVASYRRAEEYAAWELVRPAARGQV